jgi:hypothetical protein
MTSLLMSNLMAPSSQVKEDILCEANLREIHLGFLLQIRINDSEDLYCDGCLCSWVIWARVSSGCGKIYKVFLELASAEPLH